MNFFLVSLFLYSSGLFPMVKKLDPAPITITQHHEIATQYNDQLPNLWNELHPQERVFIYYMYRAMIPGNRIVADQTHRHAQTIIDIFEDIIKNKKLIQKNIAQLFDVKQFIQEAELFLVYLYAHHSHYFLKEYENHKRTPEKLHLKLLTPENIIAALKAMGHSQAEQIIDQVHASLFDADNEPTILVANNIEQSAGNFYSHDFTQEDYDTLSAQDKSALNKYFYIDYQDGIRTPQTMLYKIGGRYSQELETAHYWMKKALEHSKQFPHLFDKHIPASLAHMLRYLETGDEEYFKKFSIEWLKTHSRIDFNFGFIEVYQDPKQQRGSFEADITIKTIDMKKLNAILPSLEAQLPFPPEFKRENLDDISKMPNASVNAKLFATGDAGPVKIVAAYCLPNYEDVRSEHGSKQIMYQSWKSIGELINPDLALNLFSIKEHVAWIKKFDPERALHADLWNAQTILHEMLGHGSGKLAMHTFVEGDNLTIDGKTYQIGDTIAVTTENITQLLPIYFSGLEELRAEIISLYTSIFNFDQLAAHGLFKDWPEKIGKNKLIEWLIIHMAESGLSRLVNQQDMAQEIAQAHPQANTAILNYLLDHGGLELVEELYTVNNVDHTVIGVRMVNLEKTLDAIHDLTIEVQRIKSTADNTALQKLMKNYGACVRHPQYIKTLKVNRQAVQGNLKEIAEIFPHLIPEYDQHKNITDISAYWPTSFLEEQLTLSELALSRI